MKITLSKNQFVNQFMDVRPDNFSRDGLEALFDFLEDMESGTDEESEFDPIALCCDFSEYENIAEYNDNFDTNHADMEDANDDTMIIPVDDERFIANNH